MLRVIGEVMDRLPWKHLYICILLLIAVTASSGQSQPNCAEPPQPSPETAESLGAVAQRTKTQSSSHAKKIITDDDLEPSFGPLPRLRVNEAENGEQVIAAIAAYKQAHSAVETETAVRTWFTAYDKELEDRIKRSIEIKAVRNANVNNAAALCDDSQDYEQCWKRRRAEEQGARYDLAELANNNQQIVRLQHSLMNIRNRLLQMGFRYDWFKVRTTNNIDRL